jgi:hypothetical protein
MDDTGVPNLLSAPYLGFLERDDKTYQTTRKRILSTSNPYYMKGPVISSIGSPHIGPGWGWPMSIITQILTTDDDEEIKDCLRTLVSSTNGLGKFHLRSNPFNIEQELTTPFQDWFMSPSSPLTRKPSHDLGMLISASGVHGPDRKKFNVLTIVPGSHGSMDCSARQFLTYTRESRSF